MKGVIFTTFEAFVIDRFGEEFLDELFEASELKTDEAFVAPGTYPDEDLLSLVANASRMAGLEPATALRAFGRFAFPRLALSLPDLRAEYETPRELLRNVDDIIHVEVRKLWPEAETPRILVLEESEAAMRVRYVSERGLCAVFEGLVAGLGDFFTVSIESEHLECLHDGANACEFEIRIGD